MPSHHCSAKDFLIPIWVMISKDRGDIIASSNLLMNFNTETSQEGHPTMFFDETISAWRHPPRRSTMLGLELLPR
jgi:hypothetical protein